MRTFAGGRTISSRNRTFDGLQEYCVQRSSFGCTCCADRDRFTDRTRLAFKLVSYRLHRAKGTSAMKKSRSYGCSVRPAVSARSHAHKFSPVGSRFVVATERKSNGARRNSPRRKFIRRGRLDGGAGTRTVYRGLGCRS